MKYSAHTQSNTKFRYQSPNSPLLLWSRDVIAECLGRKTLGLQNEKPLILITCYSTDNYNYRKCLHKFP